MTNLRERGDESLADAVSKVASSKFNSTTRSKKSAFSYTKADPNQALFSPRMQAGASRILDKDQDRYGKRVSIGSSLQIKEGLDQ
jgi:hypothetical protein